MELKQPVTSTIRSNSCSDLLFDIPGVPTVAFQTSYFIGSAHARNELPSSTRFSEKLYFIFVYSCYLCLNLSSSAPSIFYRTEIN